ncbi:MAG TPA: serine--tRNA ligase, partial [Flavobacteriales bacterium]|nr:serine--tRNA ligase [Flavobacteriales bacterium]
MLTIQSLRDEKERIITALQKRHFDAREAIEAILEWDSDRRKTQAALDETLAQSNALSREIGGLMREGKKDEAEVIKSKTAAFKVQSTELKEQMQALEDQIHNALCHIPNAPHGFVTAGRNAEDNIEIFRSGNAATLDHHKKPHWEIAEECQLIDFELGAKVTGAGFPFYRGKGAKLQRGLIRYFLERADEGGYEEFIPPHMINAESGFGTGQLPDKEGQMYHMPEDELYMIPTAEVPLTNIYRDVIVKEADLPIKLCGYTPCFRREAGSYGKDVRGLNRLHQFDKVEVVQLSKPEASYDTLDSMVDHVKGLLEALELPYRILRLCGGDMGFTAAMTYDFEVWSAAQERWLEVSSVSNFETYQAHRLKCRYKSADGKSHWV